MAITEMALKRENFDEDVVALGEQILHNWLPRSLDAANEKKKELNLFLFTSKSTFKDRLISRLAENGLLEYIEKQTGLTAKISHFLLEKSSRVIEQYENLQFDEAEGFHHFYLITIRWFDSL
jgi:hypothetical protein